MREICSQCEYSLPYLKEIEWDDCPACNVTAENVEATIVAYEKKYHFKQAEIYAKKIFEVIKPYL